MPGSEEANTIFVGRTISAIEFVRNYVRIHFDHAILALITDPVVIAGETEHKVRSATNCHMLVKQIGRKVVDESVVEGEAIRIWLDDGTVIAVSLRDSDRIAAEAAMFFGENRDWWVW